MNINRYNYEEYFLLYLDNELSASERRAVEAFVEQHPDLEEELSILKQSLLKPDASVVMEDKSSLFKSESFSAVTLENYETFFLLYVDEELNAEERRAVETFADKHPSLLLELSLLMQTKLQADESIVFPDKNVLYRVPVIGQRSQVKIYRMVAVAAVLLVAAGIFWLMPHGNSTNSNGRIATKEQSGNKKSGDAVASNGEKKARQQPETTQQQVAQVKSGIKSSDKTNETARVNNLKKENEVDTLKTPYVKPLISDGPSPDLAGIVQPSIPLSTSAIALDVQGSQNIAGKKLIVDQPVDAEKTKAVGVITGVVNPEDPYEASTQNKSKLRGFFRQVKRVVEKTTRVPGEENKKVLIGNIEIAVK
jgi:hypothetical protein